jgi:hypothetical protein
LVTALKVGKSTVSITNLSGTLAITGLVTVLPAKPDSLGVGLLAFYPFNNSAADSSGHGYNGTVYGATSTTDRFGNANSAYYFNGISSYITVDDAVPLRLNNTDFTINYWVYLKRYDYSSGTALITKNSGAGQQGWNCSIVGLANYDGAAVGNAFFGESGGTDPFAISTAQLDTAKWYMITIIYQLNKGKISFYINSVYDSSVLNMPTPNPATTAKMHFGNNSLLDIEPGGAPGYFLKGELDGIRIYSRRLNVTEINYLYSSTSD